MVMKELIRCDEETQKTFLKEVSNEQQQLCDFPQTELSLDEYSEAKAQSLLCTLLL